MSELIASTFPFSQLEPRGERPVQFLSLGFKAVIEMYWQFSYFFIANLTPAVDAEIVHLLSCYVLKIGENVLT